MLGEAHNDNGNPMICRMLGSHCLVFDQRPLGAALDVGLSFIEDRMTGQDASTIVDGRKGSSDARAQLRSCVDGGG